jgi:hypothetical protein
VRKSQLEILRERKRAQMAPQEMDLEGLLRLMCDPNRVLGEHRKLNPTQREFIYDNRFVVGYMGAAGAAKTSSGCAAVLIRGLMVPDSRILIARHDYNDLMDTTAKTMESMINALPPGTLIDRNKAPPMKWWIRPIGYEGDPSEVTFMGLKENLGGYPFTDAFIDECDEVPREAFHLVKSRLRYVRNGTPPEQQLYTLRFAFNPPDTTHWLYEECTGLNYEGRKVQEASVDHLYTPRQRENEQNLRVGYYDDLLKTLPKDLADRLVRGLWGATFPGQPVFREFSPDLHIRRSLGPDPQRPVYRFWDFGYNRPYCCWAQEDWAGRLLVFREVLGEKIEASAFARRVKSLSKQYFPRQEAFVDFGDPAIVQKKDTGSTLAVFVKEGINMHFRKSQIEEGLRLIRERLSLMIEQQPALQFDQDGCPILIRALRGGYHLDEKNKPKKDGFYDHPVDAFRYGVINTLGGGTSTYKTSSSNALLSQHESSLEYDPSADTF